MRLPSRAAGPPGKIAESRKNDYYFDTERERAGFALVLYTITNIGIFAVPLNVCVGSDWCSSANLLDLFKCIFCLDMKFVFVVEDIIYGG